MTSRCPCPNHHPSTSMLDRVGVSVERCLVFTTHIPEDEGQTTPLDSCLEDMGS